MGDTLLGIVGKDFCLLAADATASFSIILMKDDEDKLMHLDDHKILAAGGEKGDRAQFTEFIRKNMELYRFKEGRALRTKPAAHFIRSEVAYNLRRHPYFVNMLLGGYDEDKGPTLYYLDYLGGLQEIKHGAHGYGSYFSLSIMDQLWRHDLELDEALVLMKKCIREVQKRLLLSNPAFIAKVVDKDGIRFVNLPEDDDVAMKQ
eukprot:gb/GECH01008225.1/.p1 GENE.gb/GECH01008225.1/~~gb/GECH01008225.1/.p1  ORF type:complete len:204 (+),score=46.23 gb/GECH01008225.1/:1-612(+)